MGWGWLSVVVQGQGRSPQVGGAKPPGPGKPARRCPSVHVRCNHSLGAEGVLAFAIGGAGACAVVVGEGLKPAVMLLPPWCCQWGEGVGRSWRPGSAGVCTSGLAVGAW